MSGARSRARQRVISVSGGGGGGPAPAGNVAWGPDFGGDAGNDDNTYTLGAAADLESVDLAADLGAGAAVELETVNMASDLTAGVTLDFEQIALNTDLDSGLALTGAYRIIEMLASKDHYLDRSNGTTNFGGADPLLAKQNTPVTNDDKNAYILWDFSALDTGTPTAGDIDLEISHDGVVAATLTYEWYTHPSDPMVEGSDTWDANEPLAGTTRGSATVSVSSGAAAIYTLTFPAAVLSNIMGNYFYVRIRGNQGVGGNTTTFSVTSSEGTNVPLLNLDVDL